MKKLLIIVVSFYASSLLADINIETQSTAQQSVQPKYSITLSYPQIKSPANSAEQQFNQAAKKMALNQAAQFKKDLSDSDTNNLPAEIKTKGSTLTTNYELATAGDIVSVRYYTNSYIVGAAHPSHQYSALNYDLSVNKPLTLPGLFQLNSNYLAQISKESTQKVTAKLKELTHTQVDLFKDGLTPVAKNFAVWNLTPQGIKFTFNEGDIVPYAVGPQEIIISYPDLKKFLATNTTLTKCLDMQCPISIKKQLGF